MGKCDSTNLPGRLFCTQLHNHNEILHNHYYLSISVSKISHIIWSFLLLSCHSYSCLVHLAPHNVKGPDDAYKNLYPLKIQNRVFFIMFPKHSNPVSARIYHERCCAYDNKRHYVTLTVYKHFLKNRWIQQTKLYLRHPTICLESHLQQFYSISYSWLR